MNIAFFCIPAHGHTNPTLAVVRELTARGRTVRYYTTEAFRAKVEAAGAVFVPFDAEAARPGMTAADGARLGSDLAFSTRLIVDLTLAADDWLSRELTVHRPDVIVGDSMAFWAKLAAKKHGIPFVSSTTTFAFNRFSAKVIGQNGAGFLQFLLAQPRINRQLKRLRAAGYAVKSVFDIIANDNETETVVYKMCIRDRQETNLFTGTVMENIRYGRLDATDEECRAAARLAGADDFITRLPQGYDTLLTNNGANLSQGQRQLIAIARAAVADPPVMILDEATSSIDTRTEAIVQRGMDQLMEGRTVFVIAHRLSTVKNSDVIMVLDHGRIRCV